MLKLNRKTKSGALFITQAAVIAAAYVALTYFTNLFGLAYTSPQLRLSEVLTVLPVFTPAAIPGLVIGCLISNIGSPIALDMVFGTAATLLAAVATRALRKICFKGLPVVSLIPPVLFNAVIVGFEVSFFLSHEASFAAFLSTAFIVGLGQAIVCFGLGLPLAALIKRTGIKW